MIPGARSHHFLHLPPRHSLRQRPERASHFEGARRQLRFQLQIDTSARRRAQERRSNQPCRHKILGQKSLRLTNRGNAWNNLQTSLTDRRTHPTTADAAARFLPSFI